VGPPDSRLWGRGSLRRFTTYQARREADGRPRPDTWSSRHVLLCAKEVGRGHAVPAVGISLSGLIARGQRPLGRSAQRHGRRRHRCGSDRLLLTVLRGARSSPAGAREDLIKYPSEPPTAWGAPRTQHVCLTSGRRSRSCSLMMSAGDGRKVRSSVLYGAQLEARIPTQEKNLVYPQARGSTFRKWCHLGINGTVACCWSS
jgi:hypothetical protein